MANDLISRQAAIDAVLDLPNCYNGFSDTYDKACIIGVLEELPSAEPEIIRCKDCKWFRKEYGWNCIEYTVCGVSPTHHPIRTEEDFCSHAERRTDE